MGTHLGEVSTEGVGQDRRGVLNEGFRKNIETT